MKPSDVVLYCDLYSLKRICLFCISLYAPLLEGES